MTTNQKFPYEEQVGVLRLFVCREGNRGEKPKAPGHGSREQSRVKRSQDFSHYEHWEALEGSRRSPSSKRHADTVLCRMPPALPAQGCNIWGANRSISSRSSLTCRKSFSGKPLGEGWYLLALFLLLHRLLMPLLETGYWAAGTFSLAALLLPSDFVYKIMEDEPKAASGMK